MLHFVISYMKQNKGCKQTLESAQYGLEILIKYVIKREGHRARFHATMLINMVIKVTFGDLRVQEISAIILQCGVLCAYQCQVGGGA